MYDHDLAYIHDTGFGDFARNAGPGILAAFRDAGIDEGTVVDLGCGSGIWLEQLLAAGYSAVGVERSAAFVKMARDRAPGAEVVTGTLYGARLPACAAVTAMGEVLGYLPEGVSRAPSLPRLFGRVASALAPGGLFIFDMVMPSPSKPMCYRTWRSGEDWTVLVEAEEDVERSRLKRRIVTFRRVGKNYRRVEERHILRLVPQDRIETDLRAAGFSVRSSRRYGGFEMLPGRRAFRARLRS